MNEDEYRTRLETNGETTNGARMLGTVLLFLMFVSACCVGVLCAQFGWLR